MTEIKRELSVVMQRRWNAGEERADSVVISNYRSSVSNKGSSNTPKRRLSGKLFKKLDNFTDNSRSAIDITKVRSTSF
jgi:hypothetical protein